MTPCSSPSWVWKFYRCFQYWPSIFSPFSELVVAHFSLKPCPVQLRWTTTWLPVEHRLSPLSLWTHSYSQWHCLPTVAMLHFSTRPCIIQKENSSIPLWNLPNKKSINLINLVGKLVFFGYICTQSHVFHVFLHAEVPSSILFALEKFTQDPKG